MKDNNQEKHKITMDEVQPFNGTFESKITTTLDLSRQIGKLFASLFTDYEGCVVSFNHLGTPTASLYFTDKNGGDVKPLAVSTRGGQYSPAERIKNFTARNQNKTFELSDALKECLEPFVITQTNKVDWSRTVSEVVEQGPIQKIYVRVDNLNVNALLKLIHGAKGEAGQNYEYNINVVRPLGGQNMGYSQNYLITIQQLDKSDLERIALEVGMIPSTGSVYMVRS